MSRKQDKIPGKFGGGGILTRQYKVVARNTTFEEVNDNSVSANTLYRCVDGLNLDRISFFTTNILGDHFVQ